MDKDKELYKEFLNGNDESFEKIIRMYRKKLEKYVNSIINDETTSEDIVQDVFVYILIHKEKYNFKYSLKAYLYLIAKCRALNLKKRKRIIKFEEYCENSMFLYNVFENDIVDKVINSEKIEILKKQIKKLKPLEQRVMFLNNIEQLSQKEISIIEKIPISKVKNIVFHSKKKLKKILEERGCDYE